MTNAREWKPPRVTPEEAEWNLRRAEEALIAVAEAAAAAKRAEEKTEKKAA